MASIQKRGDNSYRITVSIGYDSDNKKIRKLKSVTLDPNLTEKQKEKELQKLAAEFERQVETGQYIDSGSITFEEYSKRWLEDYAEKQLEPKTLHRYKEMLNSRVIPCLGHIKLQKLQPTHLLEFYNNLQENGIRLDTKYIIKPEIIAEIKNKSISIDDLNKLTGISLKTLSNILHGNKTNLAITEKISKVLGISSDKIFTPAQDPGSLSERTILHHHRLISSMLQDAVEWQLLLINPASRVKPPKVTKKQIQFYDEDQTKALIKALDEEPMQYKVMVILDVFTGFRCGELMGLEWSNVDFNKGTIEINKASQYLPEKGIFTKEPKNKTSERTISVPGTVISLLEQYKAWQSEQKLSCGELWHNSDRLFTTWDGKPLFTYALTNWFPEFLKRHNLPKITPHGLRHTSATLLAAQGLDAPAISKRLGHARTSTTMDIYAHALRSADKTASDMLENALINKGNTKKQQA